MKNTTVAIRYAKAYFENCMSNNTIENSYIDILIIKDALNQFRELKSVLSNPIIKMDKKKEIISELFKDRVSEDTIKFLFFVVEQNRIDILNIILDKYCELYYEYKNILNVEVCSYIELTEEQKSKIINKIKEITKKNIQAVFKVDTNTQGGFVLYFNDLVYDYSFKKQINKLRAELLK